MKHLLFLDQDANGYVNKVNVIMKKFTDLSFRSLWQRVGLLKLSLVVLCGLTFGVAHAQPANDNFTNAIDLTPYGDTGSTNGSNVGATTQSGESFSHSVWYAWTASANETVEFDPTGSSFGLGLAIVEVYTTTNVASGIAGLQSVGFSYSGYLSGTYITYTNDFQAVAGQTYYISVSGYIGASGTFQLNWVSSPPALPPPNDNFANATVLSGDWGNTTVDNTMATAESNEPSHAGFPATASVWYQWTASVDGEVTLDTIGSNNVDTVLAVYVGTSLATLNQVAANDDLYPINSLHPQYNYQDTTYVNSSQGYSLYAQRYYGPSGLRFNAKAGTTYYFAVDSKNSSSSSSTTRGNISLSWAYKPAGVFRFATEGYDPTTQLPLYQCAQTESYPPNGLNNSASSTILTYYTYNAEGVLVTVTRVAGSTGRATVDYTTVDGTALGIPTNLVAGIAGLDYTAVSGTLIFDDFEMSKTILIPIIYNSGLSGSVFSGGNPGDQTNRVFGIKLSNPQLDLFESPDNSVSMPRVDPRFSTAMIKILNVNADPYGPETVSVTNQVVTMDPITLVLVTNDVISQQVIDYPTNAIFNFEKANYRVPADVNDPNNQDNWNQVTIWVERFGTNSEAATLNYRVDNFPASDADAGEGGNARFPLQPGSDYAVPPSAIANVFRATTNSDFEMAKGTISFPSSGYGFSYQPITFTIPTSKRTKFNKDFRISLYRMVTINNQSVPRKVGTVNETTVTILFNDENPPAGSVDELYNPDFNRSLALPPDKIPQTVPNNLDFPGVSGEVYGLVVLPNDETMAVGDFSSYNGNVDINGIGQSRIALINKDGSLDASFNSGAGPDAAINAVAVANGNQCVIGGSFLSYDSQPCGRIARINLDGSLDLAFSAQGSGADAPVRALAVQDDGKVLIGGEFQHVHGALRKYVARLNADGSLDTSFDAGNTFNGPISALVLPPSINLAVSDTSNGRTNEVDRTVNMGPTYSATLTVNFNSDLVISNQMQVYYGDTNVAAGTGVLIFDTGSVIGPVNFVLPIGPTNGLSTNVITLVVNPGGGTAGTTWSYVAAINKNSGAAGVVVGGQFSVAGKAYKNIARLVATNGVLDTTFSPITGPDDQVLALGWQYNNQIIAGGVFRSVDGRSYNHIVRFNPNGSVDTTNFFVGIGANNLIYNIMLQPLDGKIYIGGAFTAFNGTHRLGFARLYADGTVDTTFLDTAYNQFAGLKRVFSYEIPAVFAAGIQSDGNVMIGGAFNQVGGGQANTNVCNTLDIQLNCDPSFADANLWVEPKTRDGVRNRSSIARLIGGATPGPGNFGLKVASYSKNKSSSSVSVDLVRTNGTLGPVLANFSVQPGLAQSGVDYVYNSTPPLYWIAWDYISNPTRQHSDGLYGVNGFLKDAFGLSLTIADAAINNLSSVTVSLIKNPANTGNLDAQFQLANPSGADLFYLGGENIPIGGALGASTAPLTIIDDTKNPGTFGFSSSTYIATNLSSTISVLRSNGVFGSLSIKFATSDGTAVAGTDYLSTNRTVPFADQTSSNAVNVTVKNNGLIYSGMIEKTVNLSLSGLTATPGAAYGITNAVLRLINPNFQGYLTFSATNYTGALNSGYVTFVVNRVGGNLGKLSVMYSTTNGTALDGVDYVGATNRTLSWDSRDVSPRLVSIPLLNSGIVGPNKQFNVALSNPQLNDSPMASLMGLITNASLTISNDNSYGTLQFSAPSYTVNENGGYATLTVVRVGGASGSISAHYTTSDGTATNGANYTFVDGTLTLAAGQISTNFTIPILNDGKAITNSDGTAAANLFFNVSLVGPGTLVNAVVQIVDAQTHLFPSGSADQTFNTDINGNVLALALQTDGKILAGGNFTAVGSTGQGHLTRLYATNGVVDAGFLNGLAGVNGSVQTVVCQTDGRILLGGAFTSVNNVNQKFIARLMTDGSRDTSFNPGLGADNVVNVLAETFVGGVRKIYVGGAFNAISSITSPSFARLNNDGSPDSSFPVITGADGQVYTIAVYPTNSLYAGKVLIGGTFAHLNGVALNRLARFNADGLMDTNFNINLGSGPSDVVRTLAIQPDGRILVGGSFLIFNGMNASHIARLNPDGTLDTNFVAATSDTVDGITLQSDNRIVVVGQFTQANNVTRNHITRLLPSGATDPTINFGDGANGEVDAVVVQPADGNLVIGGSFSQYDNQPHANIARIYGGSITGSGAFEFTAGTYQVDETGVYAPIGIRRIGGTSGTNSDGAGSVFVHFSTTNDPTSGGEKAMAGTNYVAVNTDLEFPAGEVFRQVLVPILHDGIIRPDLIVDLALSNPTPPTFLTNQPTARLTIVNQDSSVCFSNSAPYVQKDIAGGLAPIYLVRQGGTAEACTVDFFTSTNGTAVAGVDYEPTNRTVVFNPGETIVPVQVGIINNNLAKGNTTVSLHLTNASNTLIVAPSNAVLTILDSSTEPGRLVFSATNYVVNEGDGTAILTVSRIGGLYKSITVNYFTVDGTARDSANYTAHSGVLTFDGAENGSQPITNKDISVILLNNDLVQGPVSFSVVLSNSQPAGVIGTTNATVTIMDNDVGFAFLNATNYCSETNPIGTVLVQRIGLTNAAVQVSYYTTNGTAQAGTNYTALNGTLYFNQGESLKAISLPLIRDPRVTGDLTLGLGLFNGIGGQIVSPSNAVVIIQDGDAGLSFTNATMSVAKNAGSAIISVICSNTNAEPVSVDYATADGSATANIHYIPTSGTLTFSNGVTTNVFVVPIINNGIVESNRTFTVSLSNPTAPGRVVSPGTQTVTIEEANNGYSFSSPTYTVLRSNVAATITVRRAGNTNSVGSVFFSATNGTGTAGLDYLPTNGVLVFTNGVRSQTFAVTVIANTKVQPDRSVLLQLFNPSNGILSAPSAAILTIHDTSGSLVVPAGSALTHESIAPANGIIDPGENVTLLFAFRASGGTNIPNVMATLLATNGITVPSPASQNYGSLVVGGPSVSRAFSFTASGTNGQQIAATFQIGNGVANFGTAVFTYTLGTWTNMFTNAAPIIINDNAAASPYPSAISVSGLGGTLIKATVTFTNLTHRSPGDIDALLVSPSTHNTLLMTHAGAQNAVNHVTLTFDDAVTNSLPQNGQIISGTNKPTSYLPFKSFP